ncbi:MAG TPA: dicarboxylate/amino acid:cation symporter [Gemmatimonadaceae bacterium]|nr:dicarboxylate/amino acid:cation symporter [Gemmatimonadaceae bacterium]
MTKHPTLSVAVALVGGFFAGMLLRDTPIPGVVEPVGTVWINAIRMPVLPLIVTMLIAAIAGSGDPRRIGALGARTLGVMVVLLSLFAAIMTPLSVQLLGGITFDPESTAALREAARFDPSLLQQVTLREWLLSLVPANPIRAAADGALLPLVVFSLAYGLALARVSSAIRDVHVRFCEGVSGAMMIVIRWVLVVAPIGIFALAMSVGAHLGAAAAGAIVTYIVACAVFLTLALALLYLITVRVGRIPLRTFASALLPAQSIAFTSRSSLASFPVLLGAARVKLGLPESVAGFVLPLCASIFKLNSPITWPLGAVLVARLYGVDFSGTELVIFAVGSVILSLTTPGIPSGGFFVQAPLYLAVGLPPEGLGILIAVDFIPDLFKTTLNLTSYASTALLVSRAERQGTPRVEAEAIVEEPQPA